jgi:hypothetical protein
MFLIPALLILEALNNRGGVQRNDGWRPGQAIAARRADAKQDGRWYFGKNLRR